MKVKGTGREKNIRAQEKNAAGRFQPPSPLPVTGYGWRRGRRNARTNYVKWLITLGEKKIRMDRRKEANTGPFSGPKAIYRKILPLLWNTANTTNIIYIYIYEEGREPGRDKGGSKASVKKNETNKPGREGKKQYF